MRHTAKILGMTAAIALLSAPAMAGYKDMSDRAFDKIDTNNNGRITLNEFENNTIHRNDSSVFKMYDQDNDGSITRAELRANSKTFAEPGNAGSEKNYQTGNIIGAESSAFAKLDTNNDNLISMNEFENGTMHDNDVAVFKMYDQDNSGFVTEQELANNSKIFAQPGDVKNTTSNLKTRTGQKVGSMDAKYYNTSEVYVDNPFVNDPEIAYANDTNWDWPKDWKWSNNVDPNQPLFDQLDTNNNGRISQSEFMNGTQHRNEAAVFTMFDKNENNSISEYELSMYEKTGGRR